MTLIFVEKIIDNRTMEFFSAIGIFVVVQFLTQNFIFLLKNRKFDKKNSAMFFKRLHQLRFSRRYYFGILLILSENYMIIFNKNQSFQKENFRYKNNFFLHPKFFHKKWILQKLNNLASFLPQNVFGILSKIRNCGKCPKNLDKLYNLSILYVIHIFLDLKPEI